MADFAGTTGHDTYAGTNQADTIADGGGGNDSLAGGRGADEITVTGGRDTVVGGDGVDTLVLTYGESGIYQSGGRIRNSVTDSFGVPTTYVDHSGIERFELTVYGDSTLAGGALDDTIVATGFGSNSFSGGGGNDVLTVTLWDNQLDGGAGDDLLTLADIGRNTVEGGEGRDRLVVTSPNPRWFLEGFVLTGSLETGYGGELDHADSSEGNILFFAGIEDFSLTHTGTNNASLRSGDGDDSLTAASGDDYLFSGAGNDTIDGGGGFDAWGGDYSAASVDIEIDLNGPSTFLGGSVVNIEGFNSISTGSGDDRLVTTTAGFWESIVAGGGDDVIVRYGQGFDTIDAGAGRDRLTVEYLPTLNNNVFTSDFIIAGSLATGYSGHLDVADSSEGNIVRFSGVEDFTLTYRGAGSAGFRTGDGDDSVTTGSGADELFTGGGRDTIDAGAGFDRWGADLSTVTGAVVIDLRGASTFLGTASVVNVEGFSTLSTGSGADRITGTTAGFSETINSGEGADVITLFGLGTDSVNAGGGSDRLVLTFSTNGDATTASLTGDLASGYSGLIDPTGISDQVTFAGVERFDLTFTGTGVANFQTGDGEDTLRGGAQGDGLYSGGGKDRLQGGAGDDLLEAGEGRDRLEGGEGADVLRGGLGVDNLLGGSGADTLTGGAGKDQLTGGADADRFVYSAVADSGAARTGRDQIRGFEEAGGDRIDLSTLDANAGVAGDQAFVLVGASSGAAGELWLTLDGGATVVRGDVDGGGADFSIEVASDLALTAAAFVL